MSMTMAELLAKNNSKPVTLHRGEEVEGKVINITQDEIILDLGAKAEGVLNKKDLNAEDLEKLKVGDKLKAFVSSPETESGQVILTLHKALTQQGGKRFTETLKRWQKFLTAAGKQTTLTGQVVDLNKGGLVVDIDGIRGFLPASQVGVENMGEEGAGLSGMVGKDVTVNVIEADPAKGRLILSTRKKLSEEAQAKLANYKPGEKVSGKVAGIVPFGLLINLDGVEGVVYTQEISWEGDFSGEGAEGKLAEQFKVGQEIEAKVLGVDEVLGRVKLSIKQLTEDPMAKMLEKYQTDDVVSGEITDVNQQGVTVKLKDGVEGVLPASKMKGEYAVGQTMNFLVDSVDAGRRRVNLTPFITSTEGLIYK